MPRRRPVSGFAAHAAVLTTSAGAGVAPAAPEVIRNADGSLRGARWDFEAIERGPSLLPLGFLERAPGLRDNLLRGVLTLRPNGTRRNTVGVTLSALRAHFVPFLDVPERRGIGIADVSPALMADFKRWLDANPDVPSKMTRGNAFRQVLLVLGKAGGVPQESLRNLYEGSVGRGTPRKSPPAATTGAVIAAARAEALRWMARRAALDDDAHPLWNDPVEAGLLATARHVRERYGDDPPNRSEILAVESAFGKRTVGQSYNDMASVLVPMPHSLMPFVVLLAIHFRLDQQGLRDVLLDRIDQVQVLDQTLTRITVVKNRGGEQLTPTCPISQDAHNPRQLIDFLRAWTAPLRRGAPPHVAERLLIARTWGRRGKVAATLDGLFTVGLRLFVKRNGLPKITPSQLRKGALGLVAAATGGDPVAKMVAGGHTTTRTGDLHYPTVDDAEDGEEAFGMAMMLRDRAFLEDGRMDPRERFDSEDMLSATPGFRCNDPFDGPISKPRMLCAAYGRCPACRHGWLPVDDPKAAAQALSLERAILRAKGAVPDATYIGIWEPILARLRRHLLKVEPGVRARAAEMEVQEMWAVA